MLDGGRIWLESIRDIARGMREELARVTLARKLAAVTLRLSKKGSPTMRRS